MLHGRSVANDRRLSCRSWSARLLTYLARHLAAGHGAIELQDELIEIDWLRDVVVCAQPHCFNDRTAVAVRRHDDNRHIDAGLSCTLEDGETIQARHSDVEQPRIQTPLQEGTQRLFAVFGLYHPIAATFDQFGK